MTMPLEAYHSCAFCATFVLDLDRAQCNSDYKPKPAHNNEALVFSQISFSRIRHLRDSCSLCQWLVSQWESSAGAKFPALLHDQDNLFLYATTYSMSYTEQFPIDEISFFGLWDGKSLLPKGPPSCRVKTQAVIDVLACKGDPAEGLIWNRPINTKIGSRETLALARVWLQTCLTSHSRCNKPMMDFMLKRVVKISANGSVFDVCLCEDQAPCGYVALSYCWGGDQPYKTTRALYTCMRSGSMKIDWERLPSTLRDAIKVTFALGLQYIWIDCFCIIQDDNSDFAVQMADVPTIYAKAILTIIAARAPAATDGFLQDIELGSKVSLAVKLPMKCPNGQHGNALITSILNGSDAEPIDYRGWTLQELWLSARALHFGSRQLRWQCVESQLEDMTPGCSDGWKRGYNPDDSLLQPSRSLAQVKFEQHKSLASNRMSVQEEDLKLTQEWETLISTYTLRDLGHPEDRSWAASGLAEAWSHIIKDQYVAGHWRRSLAKSLLWHIWPIERALGNGKNNKYLPVGSRLKSYLGPSWSWTSVLGNANYSFIFAAQSAIRLVVLDVTVELVEPKAQFGAVKKGSIQVQGHVRDAVYYTSISSGLMQTRLTRLPSSTRGCDLLITKALPDAIEAEFSTPQEALLSSIHVQLLEVGRCIGGGKRGTVGLVLRQEVPLARLQKPDFRTFKRLGLFHIDERAINKRPPDISPEDWSVRTQLEVDWFNECELETMIIV